MKIGIVLDDGLDTPDGVQQYILTVGKWLSANGHDVHFLVGETRRTDIPNLHSLGRNINVRFNQNRLSMPLSADKANIKNLLDKEQFDVLHVQMPFSPQLASKVINLAPKSCAVVGTFHIVPYSWLSSFGTKFLKNLTKKSLKRFDEFISVSPAAQEFAKASLGIDSKVVPNAVNVSSFSTLQQKPRSNINTKIVFLGRLVERKGCEHLLKAVHELYKQNLLGSVQVKIGGKGPLESKLKQFVAANKLERFVSFDGFVDEKDKPAYLQAADIAIFPSTGGESFGIVLVEAMAAGAGCVIGGNNQGYAGVLEDPKTLFDPKRSKDLAKLLHELITDQETRANIHKKQQILVAKYDVENIGPKIVDVYTQALQARREMR